MPAAAQTAMGPATVSDRYDETFRKYTKRFFGIGYDWRIFKAQAMTESNLDPAARSRAGARGLMQLMPTTFREVQSRHEGLQSIDDPEWNIAAGILHDRTLWNLWTAHTGVERRRFMFGSYNAGRLTLLRAQQVAQSKRLDPLLWPSIEAIAHEVPRWRHVETLTYVRRIETAHARMDARGAVMK